MSLLLSDLVLAQFDGDIIGSAASSLDVKALGENIATASVTMGSVSLAGGNGAKVNSIITSSADVQARIGSSASIWTTGAVKVEALLQGQQNSATANALSLAGGLFTASIVGTEAQIGGAVIADMDGSVTANSLLVKADGDNTANADVVTVGLGGFTVNGAAAFAEVTGAADVVASGGTGSNVIDVNGSVTFTAISDNDATADADSAHRCEPSRCHRARVGP